MNRYIDYVFKCQKISYRFQTGEIEKKMYDRLEKKIHCSLHKEKLF